MTVEAGNTVGTDGAPPQLHTTYPPPPPKLVQSTKCIYFVPLLLLYEDKSITRAIGRGGPENQDNLEINSHSLAMPD